MIKSHYKKKYISFFQSETKAANISSYNIMTLVYLTAVAPKNTCLKNSF